MLADVNPAVVERWKPAILERAAQPGPAAKLTAPISTEEHERRLDAWVDSQRVARRPVVRRSIHRRDR